MQKGIYRYLVDYSKAFDRIEHKEMMYFLSDLSLEDENLCLVHTLYYQQFAAICVNSKLSEMIPKKRCV